MTNYGILNGPSTQPTVSSPLSLFSPFPSLYLLFLPLRLVKIRGPH